MRRVVGEPEEERARVDGPGVDERQSVVAGEHVGLVVRGRSAVVARGSVRLEQVEVVIRRETVAALADQRRPLVPARRRPVRGTQSVQPFAGEAGRVAGGLQPWRQGPARVDQRLVPAAAAPVVAERAVVVRVLAGEQRGARRTAERVGGERVLERGPARGELVADVRKGLHHPGRLVVAHDHNHVRRRRLDRPRCRVAERKARGDRDHRRNRRERHRFPHPRQDPRNGSDASQRPPRKDPPRPSLGPAASAGRARRPRGASGPRPATAASSATGSRSGGCARG